jgi:hypothetical protein
MTEEEVDLFEKVHTQLEGLYTEISALSKKSQNDALNKFKLKFLNQVLIQTNELFGEAYKPFSDFEMFDENEMPTNSDAAMMLTQYLGCLEMLRSENVVQGKLGYWYWIIDNKQTQYRTTSPKNIKEK